MSLFGREEQREIEDLRERVGYLHSRAERAARIARTEVMVRRMLLAQLEEAHDVLGPPGERVRVLERRLERAVAACARYRAELTGKPGGAS